MTNPLVTFEKRGALGFVRLARPDKLNALTRDMYAAINRAIADINADPDIRVGIICGTGRAFSAGVDTSDVMAAIGEFGRDRSDYVASLFSLDFEESQCNPKPLIAAINGLCVGNGMTMALACDLRVASCEAQFCLPEVKVGIASTHGTLRSVRMAGLGKALELLLTAEPRDAEWAERAGLVNEVTPPEEVEPRAIALAETIAALPAAAIAATRQVAYRAASADFDDVVALGARLREQTSFKASGD